MATFFALPRTSMPFRPLGCEDLPSVCIPITDWLTCTPPALPTILMPSCRLPDDWQVRIIVLNRDAPNDLRPVVVIRMLFR